MYVIASSPAQHFFTAFGAGLAAFGLLFVLVGWIIRRSSHSMRGPTERAQGTIVGFNATPPRAVRVPGTGMSLNGLYWGLGGAGRLYRPTVQFTTAEGTSVTSTTPIGTNPQQGHVGDTVTVVYDRRNPERIRVETRHGVTGCLEVAFMLIGGAVAALGIIILIAAR